jgi:uncharacterized membrane protein YqaE (UPF0057 family)
MLLAILIPSLSFFFRGKIISAVVCLVLQITLIGWLPAALWAVMSLNNAREERRNDKLIRAIRENRR